MKIKEARQIYQSKISEYREQRQVLLKQKQELEKKMGTHTEGKQIYEKEAVILELSLEALGKKQEEYQGYVEKLNQQWAATANMLAAKQQGEAAKEYVEDLSKIMEVARRLMKGDVVPPTDEKKLMEYSMELYQSAKNIGALAKKEEREEHDSLWEDEKKEVDDTGEAAPHEAADQAEAFSSGPALTDPGEIVADVMESSSGEMG